MENKEFKDLVKQKEKIESSITRKKGLIVKIRKQTSKKVKRLCKKRDAAIKLINEKFDAQIVVMKEQTKKKLFLLKDQSEYCEMKAEEIDDAICTAFSSDPEPEPEPNPEAQKIETATPITIEAEPETNTSIHAALNNFRFAVKNEGSFKQITSLNACTENTKE